MTVTELLSDSSFSEYAAVMLKGFGVALLSNICATVCRDLGKSSIAEIVEAAGKLEIFLLCLPLISDILKTAVSLLEL
jgi:stage III sporulation protein AD